MKRKLKIVSVFILIITLMCNLFVLNNNPVKANEFDGRPNVGDSYLLSAGGDYIKISQSGVITISYQKGFTEFLIVATRCSKYMKEVSNPLGSKDPLSQAKFCAAGEFNGKSQVLHIAGDYNDTASGAKTKTINLSAYFSANEIYKVELISGSFIDEEMQFDADTREPLNIGPYMPLYCTVSSGANNCNLEDGEGVNAITITNRVRNFAEYRFGTFTRRKVNGQWVYSFNRAAEGTDYSIAYTNSTGIIYAGNESISSLKDMRSYIELTEQEAEDLLVNNSADSDTLAAYDKYHASKTISNVPVFKNSTSSSPASKKEQKTEVDNLIYDTIIPVLITILLILAGVTIAVEGYKIVKSADEPQERQERIKHLRNILIGIGIAMLLLFVIEPLSNVVVEFLE